MNIVGWTPQVSISVEMESRYNATLHGIESVIDSLYSLVRCGAICQMILLHLNYMLIGETYALYRECDVIGI